MVHLITDATLDFFFLVSERYRRVDYSGTEFDVQLRQSNFRPQPRPITGKSEGEHNLYQVTLPSTQNLYQQFQRIFMFRSHCARQICGRQSGSDVKQCLRKSV